MVDRREFVETVFAELNDGEHVCLSTAEPRRGDPSQVWFNSYLEGSRTWRKWQPEKTARAVYFCVSTVTGEKNDKGTMVSRKRRDLVRAHVLVLDDIGSKTDAPPVEPSYRLESSEDNFQWGYLLEPTDRFEEYEALVEAIHNLGWGDGGAGGSYRLMRVPGSANMKEGRDEFRSRVVEWEPDRVWTLEELATAFELDLDALPKKSGSRRTATGGAEAMDNIDPLLDWLAENEHIVSDDGSDFVTVICPWAHEHTTGDNTAGYSPLGRGDGDWVQTRGFSCLHEHCKDRGLKEYVEENGKRGAPHVSGYDPMPWLQRRYAYLGMGQQVIDMEQRRRGGEWIWDLADWTKRHPGKVAMGGRDVPVATAFVSSRKTRHVDYPTYVPVSREADVGVVDINGQHALNVYVPPNWEEVEGEPEVTLEHFQYLIPDREERETLINWLAWKIQNPGRRSYAVVMVADETYGTGRSWIKAMLERTLQGKVNTATLPQLVGHGTSAEQTYNDWMARCQFLVVEEAKETLDRDVFYHGYEVFKQIVDTRVKMERINPKYGRTRTEGVYFNALIFTNHRDALGLPENDRRVYVVQNPTEMQTPEYYDRLEAALNDLEAAKLFWWLTRRDVSDFDHVYPPMTPGKMLMIEQNQSPGDAILEWVVETSASDLVTKKSLKTLVVRAATHLDYDTIKAKPGGIVKYIFGKIDKLKDVKNGFRIRGEWGRDEIRAIKRGDYWRTVVQNSDTDLVKEELEKLGSEKLTIVGEVGEK